ncbi:flagellar hook-length control protein FliK [Chitinimonas lacunae]|uniref:Flagellar hook-length control protein FliK n=1 Tax=Chitinimonas lacunae TaxID=1963018 RepID=A0ABV8MX61_9NEIS
MIPSNAVAAQLQAYLKTPDLPLVRVVDAVEGIQRLFTVGEQLRAQVATPLQNGRFAVMVKDQLLDLNLPRNTEPGQELDLRVLSNSPRLVFLLQRPPATTDTAVPLPTAEPEPGVQISDTARFLASLLGREIANKPGTGTAQTAIIGNLALAEALPDTPELATKLEQAISRSGLFYESHQADWVAGRQTLDQLLKEPQARLIRPPEQAPTAPLQPRATEETPRSPVAAASEALAEATANTELDAMPPLARQMVQQQLGVLDQRMVVWQGQVWPGQTMRWEIEEEPEHGPERQQDEATSSWRTRLSLDLPHLGHVGVDIGLAAGGRISVRFLVTEAATAERIRAEQAALDQRLDAAGLELVSLALDREQVE